VYGYTGLKLVVELTSQSIEKSPLDRDLLHRVIGGRMLNTWTMRS